MKKLVTYITACFAIISTSISLHAQTLSFRNYTVRDGLAQSNVNDILRDEKGNMWFATFGGVSIYDGVKFTNYTVSSGLSHNSVLNICTDSNGVVWLATYGGGLNKYANGEFTAYQKYNGITFEHVTCVCTDSKGNLWFGADELGLGKYDPRLPVESDSAFTIYRIDEVAKKNTIRDIYEDRDGFLWLATYGLGAIKWKGGIIDRYTTADGLSNDTLYSILQDSEGSIWIGARKGLCKIDSSKNQIVNYTDRLGLAEIKVYDIFEDLENNLWFATNTKGLIKKENDRFIFINNEQNRLLDNEVKSIYQDRERNLWFGTKKGVVKLSHPQFTTYTKLHGLSDNYITALCEDSNGNLWVGTKDCGISLFKNDNTITYYRKDNGLAANSIRKIIEDSQGNICVATLEGLVKYNGKKFKIYSEKNGLPHHAVRAICEDSSGNIYCGTQDGLALLKGDKFKIFKIEDGLPDNYIRSLLVDRKKNFWIGTKNGISKFSNGRFVNYLMRNDRVKVEVFSIYEDHQEKLWLATNLGVYKFDGKIFSMLAASDEFAGNIVYSIVGDDMGNLWFGTNRGLFKFNPDNQKFVRFSYQNNLISEEYNIGCSIKQKAGKLLFGSVSGMTVYDPEKEHINDTAPPIYITNVRLFKDNIPVAGSHSFKHHQNEITFEYAGISFKDEESVRYQYRLQGYDHDWSELTLNRAVKYTSLNIGQYIFKVKARNGDGYWSEKAAEFSFEILQPFWESWWFILIELFVIGVIIYGAHLFRTAQIRHRANELEQRVTGRTKELDKTKSQLETILDTSPVHIASIDLSGKYTTWNKASEGMFGYKADEVIGKLSPQIFHPNEEQATAVIDTAIKEGLFDGEISLVRRDGSEFPAHFLVTKTIDLSGKHIGFTGVAVDITEHKRAEKEIIRKNEELEVFNKLAVDRELRMIELKKEINAFFQKLGKKPRYKIIEENATEASQ